MIGNERPVPGFRWLELLFLPAAIYLALFALLTYPLITQFSTHLFADMGDGLQNYWNLWWMNKSITQMHQPFWKTPYLHYPYGTTLIGHTLNPFNGLLAIPLLPFMSLLQAHNFIVVFSFVVGGVTAFLLARYFTRSYFPSLVAGAIFTFSNYHFSHAEGHLQLVSLEWIPLFALCWYLFVLRPRPAMAVAAAVALFLVLLSDYYYFFYCVLFAAIVVIWQGVRTRRVPFVASRHQAVSLATFLGAALITSGPLVIALLITNIRDPLGGAHPTTDLSLDLLAPFIPGGHWRFASLTEGYWSRLPGVVHESSVHLGVSVVALLAFTALRRKVIGAFGPGLWFAVLAFFAILSLGPVLHIWGREVSGYVMPYAWLEAAFPPLALSGVPVRMMVMVTLAASVISAMALKTLLAARPGSLLAVALILTVMAVEYLPRPLPASGLSAPEYVYTLKGIDSDKGVLDQVAGHTAALYYQTIHEKPMAFGYIARLPKSVADIDYQMAEVARMGDFKKLRDEFGIRFLVTGAADRVAIDGQPAAVLYSDEKVRLYDLGE